MIVMIVHPLPEKTGSNIRSVHDDWNLAQAFPALVGNKRMNGRCGCKLVITSQEIALLLLPDSEDEGTPARWRRSSNILTPSHLAGVWGEDQKG